MIKIDDIVSWKAWKNAIWTAMDQPAQFYVTTERKLKDQGFGLRCSPKDGQPIIPDPFIENVWLERGDFYWSEKEEKWSDTTQKIFIFKSSNLP